MKESIAKAKVLIESLPYLREFNEKTVVIKYGGHAMVDSELKKSFALDLSLMKYIGINPVIVHGGGPQINRFLEKMQITSSYVQGMRVTDGESMDVVEMVLVGKVNKEIIRQMAQLGFECLQHMHTNAFVGQQRIAYSKYQRFHAVGI